MKRMALVVLMAILVIATRLFGAYDGLPYFTWPDPGDAVEMSSTGDFPDGRYYDIPITVIYGKSDWPLDVKLTYNDALSIENALNWFFNVECGLNYRFFHKRPPISVFIPDYYSKSDLVGSLGSLGLAADDSFLIFIANTSSGSSNASPTTPRFVCGYAADRHAFINSIGEYVFTYPVIYHEAAHLFLASHHPFNSPQDLVSVISDGSLIPSLDGDSLLDDKFTDTFFVPSEYQSASLIKFFLSEDLGEGLFSDKYETLSSVDSSLVVYSHFTDCDDCWYDEGTLDKYPPVVDYLIEEYPEKTTEEIFSKIEFGNILSYDFLWGSRRISEQQVCSSYLMMEKAYNSDTLNIGPSSIQRFSPFSVVSSAQTVSFNRVTTDSDGYVAFPDYYIIHYKNSSADRWRYHTYVRAESSDGVFPQTLSFSKKRNATTYLVTPVDSELGFSYEATVSDPTWTGYTGYTLENKYQTVGYRFREDR